MQSGFFPRQAAPNNSGVHLLGSELKYGSEMKGMVKRSVREGGVKVGEEKMWAWAKTS